MTQNQKLSNEIKITNLTPISLREKNILFHLCNLLRMSSSIDMILDPRVGDVLSDYWSGSHSCTCSSRTLSNPAYSYFKITLRCVFPFHFYCYLIISFPLLSPCLHLTHCHPYPTSQCAPLPRALSVLSLLVPHFLCVCGNYTIFTWKRL